MNRQTTLSLAAGLALTALFSAPPVAAQSPAPLETGFINGQVTIGKDTMVYVVYVPWDYTPEKQWPVILYLQGSTLEGTDGIKSMMYGLGQQVWLRPKRFPCLVVFPQLPVAGVAWNDQRYEALTLRVLEEVIQKYHGDRSRLYLTGVSLGGDGTSWIAADRPSLFAAAIPIAAGAGCSQDLAWLAQTLRRLPLWVFHGDKDPVVPVSCSRALVAALRKAGNANVQYTEYPGIGHDSWDLAYGDPKVIVWLLAQKR
jgi:predicted peptidase